MSYYLVTKMSFSVFDYLAAPAFGFLAPYLDHALSVESASDDVISYTREVLNTSASDKNNGVLLKIVSDTRDVSCNFVSVCELNSGNLSHS